jgi:predicted nucleic acid-binding protein
VIVIDASALIELLYGSAAGTNVDERLLGAGEIHAPTLIDVEIASVIRRSLLASEMTMGDVRARFAILRGLNIHRDAVEPLLERVIDLRHDLTVYDAMYVALAEGLNAPLITCDRRLSSAPGNLATVEYLGGR